MSRLRRFMAGYCLFTCKASQYGALRAGTVTAQDAEFAPHVTATCKTGTMNIRIQFNGPYNGVVHARDFRTPACMTFGNGTSTLALSLNLLAKSGNSEYCGTLVSNVSDGDY
uniref:Uncharacterized protein n=1 Tax=Anopheles albimanus TaxID=7167 RepID=A0A182FAW7_ANOAL